MKPSCDVLQRYDRTGIGAQSYSYNGLGDRVRVDKPTGTRHFVYDAWGRVVAEYGSSASDVRAEFIWAVPPAANDNSPFGGGDHIAGYAPLALIAPNAKLQRCLGALTIIAPKPITSFQKTYL